MPLGVAVDSTGNLYIAEYGGDRVRVVDTSGNIHTIAGNGLEGFLGDGGLSTNASLNGPTDVKVDAKGNVYIADSLNSSIRKLTPIAAVPTPQITTITNSGSFVTGPVAPGERIILTGTALGPNSTVMFDNNPAPVLTSSLTSTMVVVPYEISGQSTSQVTVTTGGATSASLFGRSKSLPPLRASIRSPGQARDMRSPLAGTATSTPLTIRCRWVASPLSCAQVQEYSARPSPPVSPFRPQLRPLCSRFQPSSTEPPCKSTRPIRFPAPSDSLPWISKYRTNIDLSKGSVSVQIMVGTASSQVVEISVQGQDDDSGDARTHRRLSRPLPPVR